VFSKIKLGVEEWKKLETDLARVSSGESLEIVINLTLVDAQGGSEVVEEEEEEHHHERYIAENEFTREVAAMIDHIAHTYNVHVHTLLHSHHRSVTFTVKGTPRELIKALKDTIEYIKLNCERCVLHTVDGEFHLGEDLVGIYFGDAYKITVILPAEDGRRLKVHEVHF
jgi:hypothetical protein